MGASIDLPIRMPPRMALSDSAIRKANPADKPIRLFDGGGLYLEISRAAANSGG